LAGNGILDSEELLLDRYLLVLCMQLDTGFIVHGILDDT
jgi:hypothetical protein